MLFSGAILLHELTHWASFFSYDVPDWNKFIQRGDDGYVKIGDHSGDSCPTTGYGPFNAQQLKLFSEFAPQNFKPYPCLNNADSYMWL